MDLRTHNMCYLVVKNVGNEDAMDIKITADPSIKLKSGYKLESLTTLHQSGQIPNLWGFFMDENDSMLKEFRISLEYKGFESSVVYKEKRILDPSQFIGAMSEGNPNEDIVNSLKDISTKLRNLTSVQEKKLKTLKHGVTVRNLSIGHLSLYQKIELTVGLIERANEEDTWLYPFVNDLEHLLLAVRNGLLADKVQNKPFMDSLNKVILKLSRRYLGDRSEMGKLLRNLTTKAKQFLKAQDD